MDEELVSLEHLTASMLDRLGEASYEELEVFVNKREAIVDRMKVSPLQPSKEHAQRVRGLLEQEQAILHRMIELRNEAGQRIRRMEAARAQKHAYEPDIQPDSFFFDRKIGAELNSRS